jgi:AraC-like DNA-binding protein
MLTDPRRGGDKITTIALDAGFSDVSYFNRAFRRRYGETPSDVRVQASPSWSDGSQPRSRNRLVIG